MSETIKRNDFDTLQNLKEGEKIGYLTIVSNAFKKSGRNYYKTLCGCGTESEVWERNLISGTISCGCIAGEVSEPLTELPANLKGLRKEYLKKGKLLVIENGDIYRVKGKFYFKCREFNSSRDGRYKYISYSENGRQKHIAVHRLLGKAFIPNPENKPQINHIDGNPRNNSLDNLEWVTAQENVSHAYETGLIRTLDNTPYKCIKCKGAVMNSGSLCAECKSEMRVLKGRLLSKQNQRNKFRDIDTTTLKPRYRNIIKSRFRGDTLQEIGDRAGVSREYIRQLEERVLNKDPVVYKPIEKEVTPKPILITIKAARINADKDVNEISKKIGVTTATLYSWEKYKNKIPYLKFIEICKLYNTPLENISGYRDGNWFVATHRKEQLTC